MDTVDVFVPSRLFPIPPMPNFPCSHFGCGFSKSFHFQRRSKTALKDLLPISVRFSGLGLIIYAKISFRFRAKDSRNERKVKSDVFFVTGSMVSVRLARERWMESQQVWPDENQPFVCNAAVFLRM